VSCEDTRGLVLVEWMGWPGYDVDNSPVAMSPTVQPDIIPEQLVKRNTNHQVIIRNHSASNLHPRPLCAFSAVPLLAPMTET
jgi:hypothetical protein